MLRQSTERRVGLASAGIVAALVLYLLLASQQQPDGWRNSRTRFVATYLLGLAFVASAGVVVRGLRWLLWSAATAGTVALGVLAILSIGLLLIAAGVVIATALRVTRNDIPVMAAGAGAAVVVLALGLSAT